MSSPQLAPHLVNIRLHPIKSLDPISVPEARISPSGGLALDRTWALYSVDGKWVNGKRTPAIHLIRAAYSPDLREVTLSVPGDRREIPTRTFAFPEAYEDAAEWFSVFFDQQIIVRYSEHGFPDDTVASGPTIVSTPPLRPLLSPFHQHPRSPLRNKQTSTRRRPSPTLLTLRFGIDRHVGAALRRLLALSLRYGTSQMNLRVPHPSCLLRKVCS